MTAALCETGELQNQYNRNRGFELKPEFRVRGVPVFRSSEFRVEFRVPEFRSSEFRVQEFRSSEFGVPEFRSSEFRSSSLFVRFVFVFELIRVEGLYTCIRIPVFRRLISDFFPLLDDDEGGEAQQFLSERMEGDRHCCRLILFVGIL